MTATELHVTLEAKFPMERASALWRWLNEPREPNFDDFGPHTFGDFANQLAHRTRCEHTWGIHFEGKLVGYLGFVRLSPIAGQFHGMVIAPEYRKRGIGTAAMSRAVAELRADGAKSLLVTVFWDNAAILSVLASAGFSEVGFIFNASMRNGRLQPMRMMQYMGVG